MDYQQIVKWVLENYVAVGVGIIIVGWIVISEVKKRRQKKKKEPMPPEEKYPTPQQEPTPAFEEIDFERDFKASQYIESNNLTHLKDERERLRREIKERKEEYQKTKERHEKNILIGKRLAKHIPELMRQEQIINTELKRLEKNGR